MEPFFGIIISAALAYLLNDMQTLKKEILDLRESVIWIQAKMDRREKA